METFLEHLSHITLVIQIAACLLWVYAAKVSFTQSRKHNELRQRHLIHTNALVLLVSQQYRLVKQQDGWGMVHNESGTQIVSGCNTPEEAMISSYLSYALKTTDSNG